jgi:tetratricopeptide (TPR) repeat protein
VAESFLTLKERGIGRQLSAEERRRELDGLHRVVRELAAQADTRSEEALARMQAGDAEGAKKLYAEVLAAREQEATEIERQATARATEKRREAAKAARSLAALENLTNIARAAELYKRAAELDPGDVQTWLNYAYTASNAGRSDDAKAAFEQAAAKARDGNAPLITRLATTGLGDIVRTQGSLGSAERLYRAAMAIAEDGARTAPGNTEWEQALSASHDRIGALLQAQGNLAGALESYKVAHAIDERLARTDATNAGWQRNLSAALNRIGGVEQAQGNLVGAMESYKAALDITERLAKADPTDTGRQGALVVSLYSIGSVQLVQGSLTEALESYKAVLAIAERLAKTDATNADWQEALSASLNRIGGVQQAQGSLAGALESYKSALAITERLAKTDPTNVGWQSSLGFSHDRIGGLHQTQGNLAGALESYKAALAIADSLAKADPANAERQTELADAHGKVANILFARGDRAGALAGWRKALDVFEARAASAEEAEIKSAGRPGARTAEALGNVAWRALLPRAPKRAHAASERAHTLAPDLVRIETNRAHALMLMGRTRQARALYLAHKGKMSMSKVWEQAVAEDFADLRRAGLAHPMMAEIERALGVAQTPAAKQRPGRRIGK